MIIKIQKVQNIAYIYRAIINKSKYNLNKKILSYYI